MKIIKLFISGEILTFLLLATLFVNNGLAMGNDKVKKNLSKQLQTILEQQNDLYKIPGTSAALCEYFANGRLIW
jgi:hypothetical protein